MMRAIAPQIAVVFPEYTPHDSHHHLHRLFTLADQLLPSSVLDELNVVELSLLAFGLYLHDWGMAVSDEEKRAILSLLTDGPKPNPSGFDLLDDEAIRIRAAAERLGFRPNNEIDSANFPADAWQNYVRETHAYRSGARARAFFTPIDQGLGRAISQLCIGHAVDVAALRDDSEFPVKFGVANETVNLRAIAIYLRLIDLFDLTEHRTPYILWKYVAPQDWRSKIEWKKHRAIHSVSFPAVTDGRVIRVDGTADDVEIFAECESLRQYCHEQLAHCSQLLREAGAVPYCLDLLHVDWQVQTHGFDPVLMRFEFERKSVLRMLTDEIYDHDAYVFLRELLQNSVDAIRRRNALNDLTTDADRGEINVTIKYDEDHKLVSFDWHDNGIGMDQRDVATYFAVAGRSFYTSSEFRWEQIGIDPISQFGIGALTCFFIAEHVSVVSQKDRNLFPDSPSIQVDIPSAADLFTVRTDVEARSVGTTIRVTARMDRFAAIEKGSRNSFTDYLKTVGAFVEYPIRVVEAGIQTTICHPLSEVRQNRPDDNVQQLSLEYPLAALVPKEDVAMIREHFRFKKLDIESDLKVNGVEGVLAYPVPHDDVEIHDDTLNLSIVRAGTNQFKELTLKSIDLFSDSKAKSVSNSDSHSTQSAIYRHGILIPKAEFDPITTARSRHLSYEKVRLPCQLVANLRRGMGTEVTVSRNSLSDDGDWRNKIRQAHVKFEMAKIREVFSDQSLEERARTLARAMVYDGLDLLDLWHSLPQEQWPLPRLISGGQLDWVSWGEITEQPLCQFTSLFGTYFGELLEAQCVFRLPFGGQRRPWSGEPSYGSVGWGQGSPIVEAIASLWNAPTTYHYGVEKIHFVTGPVVSDPPVPHVVHHAGGTVWNDLPSDAELHEKSQTSPQSLTAIEIRRLNLPLGATIVAPFSDGYEHMFAHGMRAFNLNHPVTQEYIRVVAYGEARRQSSDSLAALTEAIMSVVRQTDRVYQRSHFVVFERFIELLENLWTEFRDTTGLKCDGPLPEFHEFIGGTVFNGTVPESPGQFGNSGWPTDGTECAPCGIPVEHPSRVSRVTKLQPKRRT